MVQEVGAEELHDAQQSAAAWSRLIRAPRARHRHVMVDVCTAHIGDKGPDTSRGSLVRQVL